jgi:transketolase
VPTIKPMDADMLIRSARKTRTVLTVEEHARCGGLGSAVAETLCRYFPTPLKMIAAEDGPLSVDKIARAARMMAMAHESA